MKAGIRSAEFPTGRRATYWCVSLLRYAAKHFRPWAVSGDLRGGCAQFGSADGRGDDSQSRTLSPVVSYFKIMRFAGLCLVSPEHVRNAAVTDYITLNSMIQQRLSFRHAGHLQQRQIHQAMPGIGSGTEVSAAWKSSSSTTPRPTAPWIFWNSSRIAAASTTTRKTLDSRRRRIRPSRCRTGEWVLTLNPDVLLLPNFIQELVDGRQRGSAKSARCAASCSASAPAFDLPEKQLVDSTGIYFTPMLRHLDRGSQEVDNGHYLNFEYVFGATAAAALYRREMIDDISIQGEFFDSGFLRLPRRRRRRLARPIDGLALPLYAASARLSRAQRAARQSARAAGRDQHALGEEPVPDAHQEHDAGSVPAQLAVHHRPGSGGDRRVPAARALFAQGFRVSVLRNWKRVMAKRREIMKRRRVKDD